MTALRKALAALFLVFATVAFALTPGERIVLFSGIHPVWQANFLTASSLPAGLTYTKSGSIPATLFDSAGKLTYQGNNLLAYSSGAYSNSSGWNRLNVGAPVDGAVTPPTGHASAATVTANAGSAYHYINSAYATFTLGYTYLFTHIVQKNNNDWLFFTGTDSIIGYFNVNTGSFGTTTGFVNPQAVSLGNGWWQISYVYTPTSGTTVGAGIGIAGGNGSASFTAAGTEKFNIAASYASRVTYETTPRPQDQVITTNSLYLAPRLDTNPSTLAPAGLLVEEQRVNVATYSQAISNWSKDFYGNWNAVTVTDNQLVSPDGTQNASKIAIYTGASGSGGIVSNRYSVTAGQTYTLFGWYYNGTFVKQSANMLLSASTFNSGSPVSVEAVSAIIDTTKAGWNRYSVTYTIPGSGVNQLALSVAIDSGENHQGQTFYFWGGQIELGSFATSYIPNPTSSTVTRTADVVTFNGVPLAALQGAKGTLYVETSDFPPVNAVSISDSAYHLYLANFNGSTTTMSAPSLSQAVPSGTTASVQRTGLKWNAAGASLVVSGSSISTTGTPVVSPSNAYLGSNGSATFLDGHVRSIGMFNTDLINLAFKAKSNIGVPY